MQDPSFVLIVAAFSLIGLTMLSLIVLRGWRDWIALKTQELELRRPDAAPSAGSRIEVADLKERIRKLEAIAAGVDI